MSTDPTGLRPSLDAAEHTDAPRTAAATRIPRRDDTASQPLVEDADGRGHPAPADRSGPPKPKPNTRRPRRKRKVRKVHRVVRHIEVWSVVKLATIFCACGYVVGMVSGYLLWRAADRVGTIDGIEGFFEDAGGYDSFELLGNVVFRAAAIGGLVLAALSIFVLVLGAVLFNLISDLTGGIRMTVIDEDLIVAPARRRPASAGPEGAGASGRGPGTTDRPSASPARPDR